VRSLRPAGSVLRTDCRCWTQWRWSWSLRWLLFGATPSSAHSQRQGRRRRDKSLHGPLREVLGMWDENVTYLLHLEIGVVMRARGGRSSCCSWTRAACAALASASPGAALGRAVDFGALRAREQAREAVLEDGSLSTAYVGCLSVGVGWTATGGPSPRRRCRSRRCTRRDCARTLVHELGFAIATGTFNDLGAARGVKWRR